MGTEPGYTRDNPIPRPSARVVLLDSTDRILLFRCNALDDENPDFWLTPGGGLNDGETHEAAAVRELWEETGLTDVPLGPLIWTRRHVMLWNEKWVDSLEHFFVVRTDDFVVSHANLDENEAKFIQETRWWSLPEIIRAKDEEIFAPRRLSELLAPIIAGEIPISPINTGL